MDSIAWNLIDKYFKDNPYNLVAHHLDSYNDFFSKGIFQIFRENNPIRFIERDDSENMSSEKRNQCFIYLGGKNGDKLYFGKPIIYDDNDETGEVYRNYDYERKNIFGKISHYASLQFVHIKRTY